MVTCDVDGLLGGEEGKTGQVDVQKPAVERVEVRSSRASVGDMRMLVQDTNAEASGGLAQVSPAGRMANMRIGNRSNFCTRLLANETVKC